MTHSGIHPGITAIVAVVIVLLTCCFLLTGCRSQKKEAWEIAPLKGDQIERVRLEDLPALCIERVRFYSREMRKPRFFLVLIPKTQAPVGRVLILNHGWSDRPESMLAALKLDQVYAALLSERKVHPALPVLPDVRFPDSYRRNSEDYLFPQYLILVAEEVSRTVSMQYQVPFSRDSWGIGGFSFGGYLSLDVGRRYAGRFGSVSAVSTFYDTEWPFWSETAPPPRKLDSQRRSKQTIVEPGPVPRLFLACGTIDRFYPTMVELHQKFQKLGLIHQWSVVPGGHTWSCWASVLDGILRFHLGTPRNGIEGPGEQHLWHIDAHISTGRSLPGD